MMCIRPNIPRRLSQHESNFWARFPELLFDDPEEDEHNELIGILRRTAENYFKEAEGEA